MWPEVLTPPDQVVAENLTIMVASPMSVIDQGLPSGRSANCCTVAELSGRSDLRTF